MKKLLLFLSLLIPASFAPVHAVSGKLVGGVAAALTSAGCLTSAVVVYKDADNSLIHTIVKPGQVLTNPALIAALGLASLGSAIVSAVLLNSALNS